MGYFPPSVQSILIQLDPGLGWGTEKNVLCSDWEGQYAQGQSWTVAVGFN